MCCSGENEWFRIPLFLKIFNIILLVVQCLFLICLIEHWIRAALIYIFYIAIVTFLAAVGEVAVVRRNKRLLYVYGIYLSIYLCWSAGMIMGLTMGLLWTWDTPTIPDGDNNSTTTSAIISNELNGLEMADYVIGMVLDSISMILSIVILRLLYLMLTMIKRERASSVEPAVRYVSRLPGAPPRYTPTSPHSVPPSPVASPTGPPPPPIDVEVGPLPAKEALEDRRESLPPAYCPNDPVPPAENQENGSTE